MEVSILNQSLKVVEQIYNECEYDSGDIFRIKDLIHSLDENHWRGKKWCADILHNSYKFDGGKFLVLGGWYGLLAYLLRKRFSEQTYHIISSDMDPDCQKIGQRLFDNYDIDFQTFNANNIANEHYDCIICTSVEHIDPKIIEKIHKEKDEYTWLVLQSCNLHHPTHINPHDTYQELEKIVNFKEIIFSNSMKMNGFQRHMVIAR